MMHITILRDKDDTAPVYFVRLAEDEGPFGRFILLPCLSLEYAETLAMGIANLIKFSCGIEIAHDFLGVWS